ncbi:LacI family DNA-binding transcriptional regulator [Kribbella sp. NPDC051587]|uniref:LacI family DNA-binding transcriptional regulator n=1 Tax=Kribbella sp. NPDC051587 TaxID=3364119 RepID=UPI0037874BF8
MMTMADVAHAAGVSVTTVSHVVNGTRVVLPATRERVQRAIQDLGYVPRPTTRSLSAGSHRTIGVAVTVANNPYWVEILEGLGREAERLDLDLIVVDTRDDPHHEATAVANLIAHRVDGLIIAPTGSWRARTFPMLCDRSLPHVLLDRLDPMLRVDQVGVENESVTRALIDHLIQLGHTRIGMLSGIPGLFTSSERLRGYVGAHHRANLPMDPELVRVGDSSSRGGRRAAAELLRLPDPPTALFTANSGMTVGALAALQEAGVKVPDDIALVAFDDFPWADLFRPHLTAIAQPSAAIGARAVQLMHRRLGDRDAPHRILRLPAEIMHRESCGCSAGSELDAVRQTSLSA